MKFYLPLTLLLILVFPSNIFSQENDIDKWDNQIYFANKISGGKEKFKFTGEIQIRLKDDMQQLDRWYLEAVGSFLVNKHFEIVPDIRFNIKPDEIEFRPGFGVLYKHYIKEKFQFVHQFKWQVDLDNKSNADHAVRYVLFINKNVSEKIGVNFAVGALYRWRKEDDFRGILFFRAGPGLVYKMTKKHSINFSYLINGTNNIEYWSWAGVPFIQLIINIDNDYKYVPAKYFNF